MASKLDKGHRLGPAGQHGPYYHRTGGEGRDTGIRCQLLNPVDKQDLPRLLTGSSHCLQEKHDGRRLMVRKQRCMRSTCWKSKATTCADAATSTATRDCSW